MGAEAAGAEVIALGDTTDSKRSRMDIGQPVSAGMPLGMTNIITKLL